VFTIALLRSLSWASLIQSIPSLPTSLSYSLINVRDFLRIFVTRLFFLLWRVVSHTPNPQAGGPPLSAIRDCLFDIFAATIHTIGRFLHPQPEDAPCRGDKTHLIWKLFVFPKLIVTAGIIGADCWSSLFIPSPIRHGRKIGVSLPFDLNFFFFFRGHLHSCILKLFMKLWILQKLCLDTLDGE
jgi:hypothetical protein